MKGQLINSHILLLKILVYSVYIWFIILNDVRDSRY